jgi:hypothetical protein
VPDDVLAAQDREPQHVTGAVEAYGSIEIRRPARNVATLVRPFCEVVDEYLSRLTLEAPEKLSLVHTPGIWELPLQQTYGLAAAAGLVWYACLAENSRAWRAHGQKRELRLSETPTLPMRLKRDIQPPYKHEGSDQGRSEQGTSDRSMPHSSPNTRQAIRTNDAHQWPR